MNEADMKKIIVVRSDGRFEADKVTADFDFQVVGEMEVQAMFPFRGITPCRQAVSNILMRAQWEHAALVFEDYWLAMIAALIRETSLNPSVEIGFLILNTVARPDNKLYCIELMERGEAV